MNNLSLTPSNVRRMTESIWVQFSHGSFEPLVNSFNGELFEYMDDAIAYVRKVYQTSTVGLATYEQAMLDNASWDNY